MFNEYFSILFDSCSRRKRLIAGLAAILTAAAAIGLQWISLENDLELMLPADQEVRRSLRFLQESHFSDDVIVSLELRFSRLALKGGGARESPQTRRRSR